MPAILCIDADLRCRQYLHTHASFVFTKPLHCCRPPTQQLASSLTLTRATNAAFILRPAPKENRAVVNKRKVLGELSTTTKYFVVFSAKLSLAAFPTTKKGLRTRESYQQRPRIRKLVVYCFFTTIVHVSAPSLPMATQGARLLRRPERDGPQAASSRVSDLASG